MDCRRSRAARSPCIPSPLASGGMEYYGRSQPGSIKCSRPRPVAGRSHPTRPRGLAAPGSCSRGPGQAADVSVAQPIVDQREQLAAGGELGDVRAAALPRCGPGRRRQGRPGLSRLSPSTIPNDPARTIRHGPVFAGQPPAGHPVSARKSVTLRGVRVLADQATETIAPHHLRANSGGWWLRRPEWWRLSQRAVRPMRVVVTNIFGQHRLQMAISEDQHPVEQLAADRSHPALGIGVGSRCPHGRLAHLDPGAGETASNTAVNFVSRSRITNRKRSHRSLSSISKIRAC
jgi:hypothetical protein